MFEYAQSSLEAYFKDNLKGREQDWDIITRRFEDLARSIKTIHREGIVHRYVSPTYFSGQFHLHVHCFDPQAHLTDIITATSTLATS